MRARPPPPPRRLARRVKRKEEEDWVSSLIPSGGRGEFQNAAPSHLEAGRRENCRYVKIQRFPSLKPENVPNFSFDDVEC